MRATGITNQHINHNSGYHPMQHLRPRRWADRFISFKSR